MSEGEIDPCFCTREMCMYFHTPHPDVDSIYIGYCTYTIDHADSNTQPLGPAPCVINRRCHPMHSMLDIVEDERALCLS